MTDIGLNIYEYKFNNFHIKNWFIKTNTEFGSELTIGS